MKLPGFNGVKKVEITIRLFAGLREGRFKIENRLFPDNYLVKDILNNFEISPLEVANIQVNGTAASLDQELKDKDVLTLFPPIGGG